ncbi:hypothetical protein JVT61DRAFT_336 [Boletus reticuloceps]|uniref:BTB domain-containing protein n=1 Tax=Boletus reticuloceps TaxID=495285 RepID=A0A8I2Z1I4_9AGAM|nr:hypothetical protein JVT61DRAFT_336 [Boletus reticuloceps]
MIGDSTYAAAPFDHGKADIILRSSDNIDFRVFKLFLSLASSSLETLLHIPESTEASNDREIKDGLVVIRMQANSKTLDTLLRFCYPCTLAEDPKLKVVEDLVDVLEASRKYSLDTIERKVHRALSNHETLKAEPLRCFAIARRGRAHKETLLAAKYTLTQPLIPSWFQGIGLITATDLLALLTYHQKCGDTVYALKNDLSWIESHHRSSKACAWFSSENRPNPRSSETSKGKKGKKVVYSSESDDSRCQCIGSTTAKYRLFGSQSREWWEDFMEETFSELRDKPCRTTVESFVAKTVQSVRARGCPTCSVNIANYMWAFSKLLTRKVEEGVFKIDLNLVYSTPSTV